MEERLQLRVQRYGWDKASRHYETYWSAQLRPAQDRMMEVAGLKPGERVLDVACGTGLVTFRAAEAVGGGGEVVASDISEQMVQSVNQAARSRGIDNVTARRAHAAERVFDAGSFDVVLCALGLMYVPEPLAALREMHRVLRPRGRAVAAVWGARARCGWAEIFPIVEQRVKSDVCPMFFQLGTGDSLRARMEDAGFQSVETVRITTTLEYSTADDAVGAAFAGGPVAMAYSRFDDDMRAGAHAEYLESIAEFRRGEGYAVPGEFVIARGDIVEAEA
jgi:ubiquinone/menaquinone biosynthesis C-methylase UbiE